MKPEKLIVARSDVKARGLAPWTPLRKWGHQE